MDYAPTETQKQSGVSVSVPHEAIVRSLSERYGRALTDLHQENAHLTAALETAVAERDEAARQLNEMSARMQLTNREPMFVTDDDRALVQGYNRLMEKPHPAEPELVPGPATGLQGLGGQ